MAVFDVRVCVHLQWVTAPNQPFLSHSLFTSRVGSGRDETATRTSAENIPSAACLRVIFRRRLRNVVFSRQFLKACLSAPEAGGGCTNPHWVCLHSDLMSDARVSPSFELMGLGRKKEGETQPLLSLVGRLSSRLLCFPHCQVQSPGCTS